MPTDPQEVTREHLIEWMRYLQRPQDENGQGLSAQSALQRFRSVSRFFAWLVETDELTESPMTKMRPPRVPKKLVPVIPQDALERLFRVCSGAGFEERRDKAIISLFVDTGLRVSEMSGIQLDDLDLESRELDVTGKGRRPRSIRFVRETRLDIQRYLITRARHPHADDVGLWVGKRGQLQPNGIYQMIQRRCEEAGIEPIHPHMFRHTFAHEYLSGDGNEGDLMNVTGWRSRQMLDRYGASAASKRAAEAHDRFSPRKRIG